MSKWTPHPAATLFPLLEGADFESLVADIKAHGLREEIWLDRDGRILDGRNRMRACDERTYEGDDPVAFVISLNLRRRHLNESQRAMVAARMANMPSGARTDLASTEARSQPQAAEILSVSRATVQRAKLVLDGGAEELVRAVDVGAVTVSDAAVVASESHPEQRALLGKVHAGEADTLKTARAKRDIDRQRLQIVEGGANLPEGVFEVIVIDPPWRYDDDDVYSPQHWTRRVGGHYPRMTLDELAKIEIPAADDCIFWLWTTHRFMPDAFDLLRVWGFEHKMILTWVKNKLGLGQWLRSKSEFCILAVKGAPKVDLTNQSTVLAAPAREHSRKPDEFYALVDSLCVGRKLDMFSRETRPGWAQWGSEPERFGVVA